MADGMASYTGSPFRKLIAFEMGADRALRRLRDSKLAEVEARRADQENRNFANFVAGGRTSEGFRPFNESNLPNVALLSTSKKYAPIVDAMMGAEKLRLSQEDLAGKEFDDLVSRYNAETNRMEAVTRGKVVAAGDKTQKRTDATTLGKLKRQKQGLQTLILRKYPKMDLDAVMANEAPIPQVPVTRWDPATETYVQTGEMKFDSDVEDYLKSVSELQQEFDNQGIPYDDAFLLAKQKRAESTAAQKQKPKKIKVRLKVDVGDTKAGAVGYIPEEKFNESRYERVDDAAGKN